MAAKGKFASGESTVFFNIESNVFATTTSSSGTPTSFAKRQMNVSIPSSARDVKVAIKPNTLAFEERQERLNKSIKLGYMPASNSTRG